MERVWIIGEETFEKRESFVSVRHAELRFVPDFSQLKQELPSDERLLALATVSIAKKIKEEFSTVLAVDILPPSLNSERMAYCVRSLLNEAKAQHDLEAAETFALSQAGIGQLEDGSVAFLGESILQIAEARDVQQVENALLESCEKLSPVEEVKIILSPETLSARYMGRYQLAVPVQYQGQLCAHIYLRFAELPESVKLEEISEALLNLSDAVAIALDRHQMISKAEETKTVWEASFDAVEDPVVILDESLKILRGNQAYSKYFEVPLVSLLGKELPFQVLESLKPFVDHQSVQWNLDYEGKHFQVFLDPILGTLGPGKFVLRFHDITKEKTLTDKILAKEQVAELGILVGSVAHEINNPIGGIIATVQLMLKDLAKDSELREDSENILKSAERCKRIIQTMLSLVRKSDETKEWISLRECVEGAVDILSSECKRQRVKLQWKKWDEDFRVFANKNRLLQVFFHLFQQSLLAIAEKKNKQTVEGFIKISLKPQYDSFELRIEDNGDPQKHEYEIQSSIAFTVAKMILEEQEVQYYLVKEPGICIQRLVFASIKPLF